MEDLPGCQIERKEEQEKKKQPVLQAVFFSDNCHLDGAVSCRKSFEINAGSCENYNLSNWEEKFFRWVILN